VLGKYLNTFRFYSLSSIQVEDDSFSSVDGEDATCYVTQTLSTHTVLTMEIFASKFKV